MYLRQIYRGCLKEAAYFIESDVEGDDMDTLGILKNI